MSQELDSLEQKVDQVLALCARLEEENAALRGRVSSLEAERQALGEKMETARNRLASLAERLPETE